MAHWLLKSEPGTYSWEDLVHDRDTDWDGVRNPAARLHLAAMAPGDEALFYHSGKERAVVGIARIVGGAEPDGPDGAWIKRRIEPVRPLPHPVRLSAIKAELGLARMELVRQSRLSVSPVRDQEWARILAMAVD